MKKIFFALLSASMVLFAACQPAGPEVSDEAQVIEARDASYEVTVTSTGAWTLEGEYDWMTPSATKGNGGEKITFTARVNLTDLIRTAEYTLKQNGGETVITLYQKGIKPDASVSVSLLENKGTSARFALSYSTAIEADYKEYGVYYNTSADFASATRKSFGTDMAAGVKTFELTGLTDGQVYFVWPYVQTIDVVEVVGGMIGLLEPVKVTDVTKLQQAIKEAPEYSEVRVVAGTYYTAEHGMLEMANNITVTGGWNADFTEVVGYTVVDGQKVAGCVNFAEGVTGAAIKNFEVLNVDTNAKGGIVLSGTDVTVANCYVHHCELGGDCGGIYLATGTATVANSKMMYNTAKGHGAGLFTSSGTVKVVNCLIAENQSLQTGGYYGGLLLKGGHGVVVNCTITKNYCYDETGQTWPNNGNRGGAWVKAHNNIIAGNYARIKTDEPWTIQRDQWYFQDWNDNCSFATNLIQGGKKGGISDGEWGKNIVVPTSYDMTTLFADFENGDYRLKASAADAIDKGDAANANVAGLIGVWNTDLEGKARINGSVDLGCYEN